MKKIRKVLSCALALSIATAVLSAPVYAEDAGEASAAEVVTEAPSAEQPEAPEQDLAVEGDFTIDSSGVLTKYSGSASSVEIPKKIANITVKIIGEDAFRPVGAQQTNLQSVTIPDTVTIIRERAFFNCSKLANVTFGSGLRTIEKMAFWQCSDLRAVNLPDSVETVGDEAFSGCLNLAVLTLGNNLKTIGVRAFNVSKITKLEMPDTVTEIGNGAFETCANLAKVKLSANLTAINENTFKSCTSLTEIEIPAKVKYIGDYAFYRCTALETITLNSGLETIGNWAFEGCGVLKNLEFPNTLKTIGFDAFGSCTALESIVIPDSVTSIENTAEYSTACSAFLSCKGLKSVKIGKGLKKLGSSIFEGCSSLTEIDVPENIADIELNAFSGCTKLSTVTLHEGLKTIGNYCFYQSGVTNIVIPDSVYKIDNCAFFYCGSLSDLTIGSGLYVIDGCISSCSSLRTLRIHKNLQSIGEFDFNDCNLLRDIYYEGTRSEWEDFALTNKTKTLIKNVEKYIIHCTDDTIVGSEAPKVTAIKVTAPKKVKYITGEELDVTGGSVKLRFSDNKSQTIPLTKEMCTGFDSREAGKNTVTVHYEDLTDTFKVTIIKNPDDPVEGQAGITVNGEKVNSYAAAVKKIDELAASETDIFTVSFSEPVKIKSLTFPKKAGLIFTATGTGMIETDAASLAPKGDLTINCTIKNSKDKAISLKCAKGRTLSIGVQGKYGTISGTKDSMLIIATSIEAEGIKNFGSVDTGASSITLTKSGISGAAIDTANLVFSADLIKKINIPAIHGKLGITVSGDIKSGAQIFTYSGKEELDRSKVVVVNSDSETGKKLEAFCYKKDVRAEVPDLMTLNGENCPSWEYAVLQMNKEKKDYIVKLNDNVTVHKFSMPKAQSLTINGAGCKLDLVKTKSISAGCPLTLDNVALVAGETPVSVKAGKNALTVNNSSAGALSSSGELTLNGTVTAAGAISAGGKLTLNGTITVAGAVSAAELDTTSASHLTAYSLAVTKRGITAGSSPITLKLTDKRTGEALPFDAGDKKKNVVVKSFKLPKDTEYVAGSLLLDKECGIGELVYYKGSIVLSNNE